MLKIILMGVIYFIVHGVSPRYAFASEACKNLFAIQDHESREFYYLEETFYFEDLARQLHEHPLVTLEEAQRLVNENFKQKKRQASLQIKEEWSPEFFTNPREHNNDSFQYLVHGMLDNIEMRWQYVFSSPQHRDRSYRSRIKEHQRKVKNLFENISLLSSFGSISASVISNQHLGAFANSGFIIKPNVENIYATARGDLSSMSEDNRIPPLILNGYFPIQSPKMLLELGKRRHNEVILVGTSPTGHPLEVIGILLKVDLRGMPAVSDQRWFDLKKLSQKTGLPLVLIQDPKGANYNRIY